MPLEEEKLWGRWVLAEYQWLRGSWGRGGKGVAKGTLKKDDWIAMCKSEVTTGKYAGKGRQDKEKNVSPKPIQLNILLIQG